MNDIQDLIIYIKNSSASELQQATIIAMIIHITENEEN